MDAVLQFLFDTYTILAVVPYVVFAAVFGLTYAITSDKKRGIKLSIDVTTAFLIPAVAGLINVVFGFTFILWFIILIILIAFGLVGGYQYRLKGKLELVKIVRLIWRLAFALFAALYVILFILVLVLYLI